VTQLDGMIGLIGAGNMGEAMMGAMIRSGLVGPEQILVADLRTERLEALTQAYGITSAETNTQLFSACDVVIFAVKPQQINPLLSEITAAPYTMASRKLVISIAAGVPLKRFEDRLYAPLDPAARKRLAIVRVMPNTPALVLAGMSGMSPNANTTPEDLARTRAILEAMGQVAVFDEKDLDAVTALSGSGPAYVFYLAESMTAGGIAAGLAPEDAATLSRATLEGAVKLMTAAKEPPRELRRRVTSPGGTTEAAVGVLDDRGVHQSVVDAIVAAARRSRELSQ
jgi:pyrroline-5-carboxylate reductase